MCNKQKWWGPHICRAANSYDDKIAIEIGPLLKVDNIILLLLSCVRADVCGSWTFSTPWHLWPKLLSFQFIFWKFRIRSSTIFGILVMNSCHSSRRPSTPTALTHYSRYAQSSQAPASPHRRRRAQDPRRWRRWSQSWTFLLTWSTPSMRWGRRRRLCSSI